MLFKSFGTVIAKILPFIPPFPVLSYFFVFFSFDVVPWV